MKGLVVRRRRPRPRKGRRRWRGLVRAARATTRATTSSRDRPVVSISTASSAARRAPCSRSVSRASRACWAARTDGDVLAGLGGAAAGALLVGGGEEDLQRGVGADDGADVTALGDVVGGRDQLLLARHHRLAHRRVDGDAGGVGADLGGADRVAGVVPVEQHAAPVEGDVEARGERPQGVAVVGVDAGFLRPPSATQRYIAPESRYVKPSSAATARATVDLPAPAGPSIAITMGRAYGSPTRGGFSPSREEAPAQWIGSPSGCPCWSEIRSASKPG